MTETNFNNNLEGEIAELSRQIEEKKRQLEVDRHVVDEREMIHAVVRESFAPVSPVPPASPASSVRPVPQPSSTASYLEALAPEDAALVNVYIEELPEKGIQQTIGHVSREHPHIIDAFHDALVTKLYDELKARGIIK